MATLAMAQTVCVPSASCSVATRLLSTRRCSPAATSFSGRPFNLPSLLRSRRLRQTGVVCTATEEKGKEKTANREPDAEAVTRKFGLEAGLWKLFTSKHQGEGALKGEKKTNLAKELLARYGGAYLATSISLSILSFALCYVLVQVGVDVPIVLEKLGIHLNGTGGRVGTFALAYAAHKAASPIRFPSTLALTPIVAGWFGKKPLGDMTASK